MADSQVRIQHMIIATLRKFYDEMESPKLYAPYPRIRIRLPGSEIPEWFSNRVSGYSITLCLSQHRCNRNFLGFALCAVVELNKDCYPISFIEGIKCRYIFETKSVSKTNDHYNFFGREWIDLDHLFLGFDSDWNDMISDGDYLTAVSFEFSLRYPLVYDTSSWNRIDVSGSARVKCCGVCPVYAHRSKTKPNIFSLKFGDTSEEECTECAEIKKSHNDVDNKASESGDTGSISRSGEVEVEPIRSHQQPRSFLSQLFRKTKHLVVVGGLTAFVLGVYCFTRRAVGDRDELQMSLNSRKTSKSVEESKPTEA